jgi:hypothetical protein
MYRKIKNIILYNKENLQRIQVAQILKRKIFYKLYFIITENSVQKRVFIGKSYKYFIINNKKVKKNIK